MSLENNIRPWGKYEILQTSHGYQVKKNNS